MMVKYRIHFFKARNTIKPIKVRHTTEPITTHDVHNHPIKMPKQKMFTVTLTAYLEIKTNFLI